MVENGLIPIDVITSSTALEKGKSVEDTAT